MKGAMGFFHISFNMPNILEMIDRFLNLKFTNELTDEGVFFRVFLAIILCGIVDY